MTDKIFNLNADSVWCDECENGPLQMWATYRGDSKCEDEDIIICLDCYDNM